MGGVWDFLGFTLGLCGGLYGKGGRGYTGGMKVKKTLTRQKMFVYIHFWVTKAEWSVCAMLKR